MHPKKLWAVWGNMRGLRGPFQVTWNKEQKVWHGKEYRNNIYKIEYVNYGTSFSFSAKTKKEVMIFVQGYSACAKIVRNAVSGGVRNLK